MAPKVGPVSATTVLALIYVVILGLEWRYRLRSLRLGAISLVLVVLWVAQPNVTRAARSALVMPSVERVTQIRGEPLSEYASGVRTMEEAVDVDSKLGANARVLSLAVLCWLACSPLLQRDRRETLKRAQTVTGPPGSSSESRRPQGE